MPGLAVIITPSGKEGCEADLNRMVSSMRHEVFYTSGTYSNDALGLHVGWVCHPDSYSDCTPLHSEDGKWLLFFYGEHHGDDEPGIHEPRNAAGPRAILRLLDSYGLEALPRLNGWFHGVVVDMRKKEISVFNDRYGMQRLHCGRDGETMLFASEAKALLSVRPQFRSIDPRGLAEWFSCGCVLGNRTLFPHISLMPPGSAWTFSPGGSAKKDVYFSPSSWETQSRLSAAEFSGQLQQTFARVLSRYTGGSRQIGMSLTGGLDGRMIMATSEANPGELPCYTFNGIFRECADVRIARKIATICGQSHQAISIGEEFLTQFPCLAERSVYITDGAMDVTGAAELYVNRLARQIAPVRLTGNYGSEILRRHVAFRPRALPREIFSPEFFSYIPAAERAYLEAGSGDRLSFIAFKQVPWHHHARFAVEQSQLSVRSPFLDNDLVALAFQAPPESAASLEPSLHLIAKGNPLLGCIPTDRGITYPAARLVNRIRRPFQDFLAKAEYAYDYGMPNWLARFDKSFAIFRLEKLFLGRQKFCHFRTWYRRQLSHYMQEVLLDSRSRSRAYVNGKALELLVKSHVKGVRNHTVEIHKLLSIELLHRALLERC